jgi:hypothetical protein
MPSLFETRGRLQTSATKHDVRATQPGLLILAGTEASTSFLFSTCHAFSLAEAVTRGEPRDVRTSSPSVGSSHLRGFAQP